MSRDETCHKLQCFLACFVTRSFNYIGVLGPRLTDDTNYNGFVGPRLTDDTNYNGFLGP